VVQEAYVRALTYWNSYDPALFTLDAWFKGILQNAARTFSREERSRGMTVEVNDEDLQTFNPNPYFTRMLEEIKQDVDKLKPDDRFIVSLNFFSGYSAADISRITDRSPGAIKVMLHRYKEELKHKYGEGLYG
jgi:RNA polymerase sigma-70 factor (ECF subfamily)